MKIDALSSYPAFQKKDGKAIASHASTAPSTGAGKTDVVDFSRGHSGAPDKSLLLVKSIVMRDIAQPAAPKDLDALRDRIREGSYRPSTEAIIDSILGE